MAPSRRCTETGPRQFQATLERHTSSMSEKALDPIARYRSSKTGSSFS